MTSTSTRAGRLGSAKIAIFTVVDEEFDSVRSVLGLTTFANGYGLSGEESNPDVVVFQPESRFSMAAFGAVNQIVRDYFPKFLLVVGIAGGIEARGVALGDVVVPNFIHYSELVKIVDGKVSLRYMGFDQPSIRLVGQPARDVQRKEIWRDGLSNNSNGVARRVIVGESLIAGEKIWGDLEDAGQRALLDRFDDSNAVETESAGVARAVFAARCDLDHNLEFMVIRGISDLVDTENNQLARDEWKRAAALGAARFALGIVSILLSEGSGTALLPTDLI